MQEAGQALKKLKVSSLLDLALIVPSSYEDTTLSTTLEIGKTHTLEAKVTASSSYRGKLRVTFWLPRFFCQLSSVFFRSTPYHFKLFTLHSSHYIQGKLETYKGTLQMSQPRSLKQTGEVSPRYKTVLKASEIRTLLKTYLSREALLKEGLHEREVETLLHIHFPQSIDAIYEKGKFKAEVVDVLKLVEALNHLKKLRGKRVDFPAIRALDGEIDRFVSGLPFSLTSEQQKVISDIQKDLSSSKKATKRMVVGDVGSGKTMVILASVMMALPYQTILMAPTSLLALQLYEEAKKYLPNSVKIALIMQGKEKGEYAKADFIIGTHALLFKEDLPEASLVMVDEQHRFGTKQRHLLEALVSASEKKPHFLQFSATPIPRTQAMMESELVDLSLITTTPFEREVETYIIGKESFSALFSHIEAEVALKHQVLIVYPLVEESKEIPYQSLEESRGFWEKKFAHVYVTHGKDKEKEAVLLAFREKGSILLATTVVEVGISLPRLTLIVIVGAERLGLATLHQLRGRVGRNGLKSWCYLFSYQKENFRLQQFAKTDNGFEIAKLDLQFRNSGDILDGTIQSGQRFKWLDMAEDEQIVYEAKQRLKRMASC